MDTSARIINELTQGMELAKQLKSILNSDASPEEKYFLIQAIIASYDRALVMVKWGDSGGQTPPLAPLMLSQPESSVSIDESPGSGEYDQPFDNQDQKVVSKKRYLSFLDQYVYTVHSVWCKGLIYFHSCHRKAMPTWKNQIRISTDTGLEGNTDDGYSWRKYGQKDILGAKFPR